MAGSYNHIVDVEGDLLDPLLFLAMIKNFGDAYEMAREMYGMIWWLAYTCESPSAAVEAARQNSEDGLALAKFNVTKKGR